MTGPTPDHLALGLVAVDAAPRPQPGAWRRLACAGLAAFLFACGGDGGSEGNGSPDDGGDPPLATEPVDLPPGQTVAELTWEPSDGFVTSYLVFVSRNHGSFDFAQAVPAPEVAIPGVAGDEIRITVVAIGAEGDLSPASPPSVEIRFHPALPPNVAGGGLAPGLTTSGRSAPSAVLAVSGGASAPTPGQLVSNDGPSADPDEAEAAAPSDAGPTGAETGATGDPTTDLVLTRAVRDRLLRADARLALPAAGEAGAVWLGDRVESEVLAGLTLVGTAERADGALRDLVWRDVAGQLYVSDGEAALEAEETASTLVPALQLGATERFVALADLDGDGHREWIVEDSLTGEAWIRVDPATLSSAPPTAARAAHQPATARLVGSGEFDGESGAELLWQDHDGALALARPTGAGPEILAGAVVPLGHDLIAIADLDGDGRDDLIARDVEGRLALGQTVLDDTTGAFWIEWSAGHPGAAAGAALVGTLDLDQDGRAELAWRVGDDVEIRAIGETTPRAFEF
jgi:hypothetical protein